MKITPKELNTVIASLLLMQTHMEVDPGAVKELKKYKHFRKHPPLKPAEISDLCERFTLLKVSQPKEVITIYSDK